MAKPESKIKLRWWWGLLVVAVLAVFLPFEKILPVLVVLLLVVGLLIQYVLVLDLFYAMTSTAIWLSKQAPKTMTRNVATALIATGKLVLIGAISAPFIYAGLNGKLGFTIVLILPVIIGLIISFLLGRFLLPSVWQSNLEKTCELKLLAEGKDAPKIGRKKK